MLQADRTMHDRVAKAIQDDLVVPLGNRIARYVPVTTDAPSNYRIGDIEDANVLIQNSLWLSVPLSDLDQHDQVVSLRDRRKWADNQIEQIHLFQQKFAETAQQVIQICK
ncbi:hypothetical protein WK94_04865 [Burkholderia ubonensis]|nr:hypothetical protein WK94_04865 [Burkholderia ubonensis]